MKAVFVLAALAGCVAALLPACLRRLPQPTLLTPQSDPNTSDGFADTPKPGEVVASRV